MTQVHKLNKKIPIINNIVLSVFIFLYYLCIEIF